MVPQHMFLLFGMFHNIFGKHTNLQWNSRIGSRSGHVSTQISRNKQEVTLAHGGFKLSVTFHLVNLEAVGKSDQDGKHLSLPQDWQIIQLQPLSGHQEQCPLHEHGKEET